MVGISVVGQLERQVKSVSNFENNSRNEVTFKIGYFELRD